MEIYFIGLEEIKLIHIHQITSYGGLHGLRDQNLLESAINYPQATFEDKYLHPDIYCMAAAYMYAIIKNHPFLDGNKRTGLTIAILFLRQNDISLNTEKDELFDLTIAVALSKITETEITLFFKQKSVKH